MADEASLLGYNFKNNILKIGPPLIESTALWFYLLLRYMWFMLFLEKFWYLKKYCGTSLYDAFFWRQNI